ncbi:mavicyanin-like [Impatiens glandulifera]|uniref:mavicyanin-like n=1 Tax=Impatiens glandulifera TaxID=253017 RepID=UPI001FB05CA0|nr:mavicyanin-like [Impatiens glandulifera]
MAFSVEYRTSALRLCLVLLFAFPAPAIITGAAVVYRVGDSAGWTTIGNVDYKLWAATKTFQVGDIIRFEYNPQFHKVMQVTHRHYRSCNTTHPIATHTSGNDSISIASHSHHFFLCGVPGHCQSGQKVDINVLHNNSPLPKTPSLAPPPLTTTPTPSGANHMLSGFEEMVLRIGLLSFAFLYFY